jgi:hypothetical protein
VAAFLKEKLNQDVKVVFSESLKEAMEKSEGKVDMIAGKHSVVLADAKESALTPLDRYVVSVRARMPVKQKRARPKLLSSDVRPDGSAPSLTTVVRMSSGGVCLGGEVRTISSKSTAADPVGR